MSAVFAIDLALPSWHQKLAGGSWRSRRPQIFLQFRRWIMKICRWSYNEGGVSAVKSKCPCLDNVQKVQFLWLTPRWKGGRKESSSRCRIKICNQNVCYNITSRVSDDCWPRGKSERMREKLVGRLPVPQAGIELDVICKKIFSY